MRGRDVYVVQSLYGDDELTVNDKLIRVLSFLGALGDQGARRLTMIAPYLCYSRKDRQTKPRDPVTNRYVAQLFEAVGVDRMVTIDVHNKAAYQNAFRVHTEHLTAAPAFVEVFAGLVDDQDEVVVMSPDAGGVKRAAAFRQALEVRLERSVGSAFIEKYRSEGEVRGGSVIGEVEGRIVVIIDDLISSGTTLVRAAEACHQRKARRAYAAATHGVFSTEANDTLVGSPLEKVVILDTIPPDRLDSTLLERRFEVVDSSPLLARAIQRLHTNGSIVELTQG